MRCDARREVRGPGLAEDLAARVEQDDERVRLSERVQGGRDRLRSKDHPRSPAVGRVVHRCGACRGPTRAGRGRVRLAIVPSRIRPGMLSDSGPVIIAGNRVRTSIRRVMARPRVPRSARVGRRRLGRPSATACSASRASTRRRLATLAPRRLRLRWVGRLRLRRTQVERIGVDDDLAPTRREDPDEGPDGRQVERRHRPAAHLEDLGLADPVDVLDDPELGAIGVLDGRADDLVPVVLATSEALVGRHGLSPGTMPRSVSAWSREPTSRKRTRQPGPSTTASAVAMVSGRASPSRWRTAPATNRRSG